MEQPKRPSWVKDKTVSKDFEVVDCKRYDDYKDHKNEASGYYVIIRVDFEYREIHCAVCSKTHAQRKGIRIKKVEFE